MAIVVLPRIEQENPFGKLAEVISEQALPYIVKLYANKDKIATLSNTELTDFVEVLQRQAPDLVADGKINWEKVNEWAQSDDPIKLKVATMLFDAKRLREDFANAPLIAKLQTMDIAGSVNPQELNKIFVAGKMQQRLTDLISKSNLPDVHKLLLLSNIEKFAEKPELIPILDKILSGTETPAQQTGGGTGSWRFSLDGAKRVGIQLEEPQLTPPQVSPPQMPKATEQKPVVKQVKQVGNAGNQKQPKQSNKVDTKDQKPQKEPVMTFWRDGVLWEMRKGEDGKVKYRPIGEAPLVEQDIDPLTGFLGGVSNFIRKTVGRGISKIAGRGAQKTAEKVAENVAKETAENVASKQATPEAQNVAEQMSKYDMRRKEVGKKINAQMRRSKELQQNFEKRMKEIKDFSKQTEDAEKIRRIAEQKGFSKQTAMLEQELKKLFPNTKTEQELNLLKGVIERLKPPQPPKVEKTTKTKGKTTNKNTQRKKKKSGK